MSSQVKIDSSSLKNERILTEKLFLRYLVLTGHSLHFTTPHMYENTIGLDFTNNSVVSFTKALTTLRRSLAFLKGLSKSGGTILFVSTRHDTRAIVKNLAEKTDSPYIVERWLKGLLTNWENTSTSIKFYNLFIRKLDLRVKQKKKMSSLFKGLVKMPRLPDAIFLFDLNVDKEALREAKRLNIPVIAFVDTNMQVNQVDYPILCNVEPTLSVAFLTNIILASLK